MPVMVPSDRLHAVYIVFILLGVATLLPWNCMISNANFFEVRLRNAPKALAGSFEAAVTVVFQVTNAAALLVLLPWQGRLRLTLQVVPPLIVAAALLLLEAALAFNSRASGTAIALCTLAITALLGASTALLQGGVYALAACLSPLYVQAASVGMAVSGFGVSALSFGTVWATPSDASTAPRTPVEVAPTATAYFGVSAALTAAAVGGYAALGFLPYWRHHSAASLTGAKRETAPEPAESSAADEGRLLSPGYAASHADSSYPSEQDSRRMSAGASASGELETWAGAERGKTHASGAGQEGASQQLGALELIWLLRGHSAVLAATYGATLVVFPSVTAAICSTFSATARTPCEPHPPAGRLYGELWVPLLFLAYNGGDLLGRMAAGCGSWAVNPPRMRVLGTYTAARALVALAMLLCHVVTPEPWRLPVLFSSDVFPLLFNVVLGVTNGHLVSLAAMHCPAILPPSMRHQSGPVITFASVGGLTLGSLASLALMEALQIRA
ncbi:hypothetical protein WJX81_000010 [Elliptochloris bilobata]|uniref:Equilibrative nucleoside transporter n=1 Tax=Elliptochloris bilobata TaxID=381761 RepID=A0AAW1RXB9_9CHLO